MKEFIDKIVVLPKLVIRTWICLWLILFMLLIMKYCFGQSFPIVCENENFIKICQYIDNNIILDTLVMLFFYLLSSCILFLIGIRKIKFTKWYHLLSVLIIFSGIFYIKTFLNNNFAIILEIIFGIILPIIINVKIKTFDKIWKCIVYPIVMNIIVGLWQLNFLLIRGIQDILTNCNSIIYIILQLDYYIFLIITLIEVVYFMGSLSWWFFCKDITKLNAELEKEKAKPNPNQEKIKEIEKEITKLKKDK